MVYKVTHHVVILIVHQPYTPIFDLMSTMPQEQFDGSRVTLYIVLWQNMKLRVNLSVEVAPVNCRDIIE